MAYVINDQGNTLTMEEFFEILMNYRLIFAGEKHDSRLAHEAELTLLEGLYRKDSFLVLALEMFERDVQSSLDAYLRAEISEELFLNRLDLGQTMKRITDLWSNSQRGTEFL
jgi:uncharacterized iron-regulated protein